VLNVNEPLLPALDVPELNVSAPLTPVVPAFIVCNTKLPLLVVMP
jgi:hypothetical protein